MVGLLTGAAEDCTVIGDDPCRWVPDGPYGGGPVATGRRFELVDGGRAGYRTELRGAAVLDNPLLTPQYQPSGQGHTVSVLSRVLDLHRRRVDRGRSSPC
jgi:hypothetical protein